MKRATTGLACWLLAAALPATIAGAQVPAETTIFPTLTILDPAMTQPGDEVSVSGTGGYVQHADGSGDMSLRGFDLIFDGNRVDALQCIGGRCFGTFVVPDDTPPARYVVAVEGGSSLILTVAALPAEEPRTPPPVIDPHEFSARAPGPAAGPGGPGGPGGPSGAAGGPSAKLRETDVAYLSGGIDAGIPRVVTAAGTGNQFKLTSWQVTNPVTALQDGPAVSGFDVELQRIDILGPVLVSAHRRIDGNLWLSSWKVSQTGAFDARDTRGFSAGQSIKAYGITSRPLTPNLAEIVTAVVEKDGTPHLVTWHVDEAGAVAGKWDSGPVPGDKVGAGASPVVTHQRGNEYTVNFENTSGNIVWQYWSVSAGGKPTALGQSNQRVDIRLANAGNSSGGKEISALPLTQGGQAVARLNPADDLQLVTYEHQRQTTQGLSYGQPSLISDNTADTQAGEGVKTTQPQMTSGRYIVTDGLFESGGVGQGQMFGLVPATQPAAGVGSITKSMTAHLALQKVAEGLVDLTDCVTLSQGIFGLDGDLSLAYWSQKQNDTFRVSKIVNGQPVQPIPDDKVSLRTLLYVSMMLSDTPSTLAVAEYVARRMIAEEFPDDADSYDEFREAVGATYSTGFWVDRMQAEAQQMGLTDTRYCDPLGRCHSTPQDQVTFWMTASQNPDYVDVTSKLNFTAADVQAEGDRCGLTLQPFSKVNVPTYPGFEGSKGGAASSNLGVVYQGDDLVCPIGKDDYEAKDTTVGQCLQCLVHRDTRLGRTLYSALQQAPNQGTRLEESRILMDYGYRQLFTPDRLANSGAQGGIVGDFALARLDAVSNVSAAIVGDGTLQVCLWNADETAIVKEGCGQRAYAGMVAGPAANAPRARVDMVDVTSTGSEATYLTGSTTETGTLRLDLWRVGPRPE